MKKTALLWDRPEPVERSPAVPLNRAIIVQAALALADRDGLDAVTLRGIATALGTGAMRLYTYIATKDELLDLMADAVYAQLPPPLEDTAWRVQVTALAEGLRAAAQAHPWFAELLGGRPPLGPHGLRFMETLLAALGAADPGRGHSIDTILLAARTLLAFVAGALRSEATQARQADASSLSKSEWQAAHAAYLQRIFQSAPFPYLARVVDEARHPDPQAIFQDGLALVLDAIAARF